MDSKGEFLLEKTTGVNFCKFKLFTINIRLFWPPPIIEPVSIKIIFF